MKFIIMTEHGQYVIQADTWEEALDYVSRDNLAGIVKIPDEDD